VNLQPYRVVIATAYLPVSAVLRRLVTTVDTTARVVTVQDGQAALLAYRDAGANLIFADYNLPGLNGRDLVRAIRLDNPYVPIVLLSVDPQRRLPSLSAGASHFLVKPFAIADVEGLLRELLPQRIRVVGV
jgi:CheY-like chemotaxis protein